MNAPNRIPSVTQHVVVNASQAHAFRVFTDGIDTWWPRGHHIGTGPLKKVVIEPRARGRWYAISEDDSEVETGTVLAWDPPNRVVLTWQITAEWKYDPAFVTEVEVTFVAEGAKRTRVTLEHRHLERYGAGASEVRKTFDSPDGWGGMLRKYAEVAAQL